MIKKFVSVEFNRFIDYYKNLPDLNTPESDSGQNRGGKNRGGYTRFFINLGRMDDLNPAKIIGMVNDYTGVRNIEIGEIEILKTFSFFEADKEYSNEILTGFNDKKFKNRQIGVEIAGDKREKKRNRSGGKNDGGKNFRKFGKKKTEFNKGKSRK